MANLRTGGRGGKPNRVFGAPPRFYVADSSVDTANRTIEIAGPDAVHIGKVLRLTAGSPLEILAENGFLHSCAILKIASKSVLCSIEFSEKPASPDVIPMIIAPAVLRETRMSVIIEKPVQLGATDIRPLISLRALSSGKKRDTKNAQARWDRIIVSAMKQSRRIAKPRLHPATDISGLLADIATDNSKNMLKLVLWESETARGFDDVFNIAQMPDKICIVTGPEGGFLPDEIELLQTGGFAPVSLGSTILRAETAVISAMAIVNHRYGRFK